MGMTRWEDVTSANESVAELVTNACLSSSSHVSCASSVETFVSMDDNDTGAFSCQWPDSPTSVLGPQEWESVPGLDSAQIAALTNVATKGVQWKDPRTSEPHVFTLHHGGHVSGDGNCLFSAAHILLQIPGGPQGARRLAVKRFLSDYECGVLDKEATDHLVENLYSPDIKTGWGVHIVQEVKLLANKWDRASMGAAIEELMLCGMTREKAAESVYRERCIPVCDGASWAQYMAVGGCAEDEHDIISMHYAEEGLYYVEENLEGGIAAFGDDIAIESLATEAKREIFVLQAHGADSMLDVSSSLFFFPHPPRGEATIAHPPFFLFMKGSDWNSSGGDHYEPIISLLRSPSRSGEKVAVFL